MAENNKNMSDLNKLQNHSLHLTKVKNDFISFLLKEINTHLNNLNEARQSLIDSTLTNIQYEALEQLKYESEHSSILVSEILNFLDIDTVKYSLDELQFDLKDYFEKRKNNNFPKDTAQKFPLNILFWDEDNFNKKYARIIFECLGYSPDYYLSLNDGYTKEYDIVFVDLTKSKTTLREQSDTIFAYFSDKKRPYIVVLHPENISTEQKDIFQHSIDTALISPVKIKDLCELFERIYEKNKSVKIRPASQYISEEITGKLIEEDKISFIQEIQTEEDIAFFIELIDIFIVETPKVFRIVREAVLIRDYEKIHFGGHKLRGSSLTMGIELFIDIGSQLEKNARDKNIENVELLVAELEHKFLRVVEELEEIKDNYKQKYLNYLN